jgi:hypothetical protein
MTLDALMVHSCRIDRAIPGMPDRYGHTVKTFSPGETVRCLIQNIQGQEREGPQLGGQVVSDSRIYLGAAVLIAEQDQITDVTTGHLADVYDVQLVETWDYGTAHREVAARKITTGEVS